MRFILPLLLLVAPLAAQDPSTAEGESEGPRLEVAVLRCLLMRDHEEAPGADRPLEGELVGLEIVAERRSLAPGEELKFQLGALEYTLQNKARDGRVRAAMGQAFEGFGHSVRRSLPIFFDAAASGGYPRAGVIRVRRPRGRGDRRVASYLVFALGSPDDDRWGQLPATDRPADFVTLFRDRFRDEPNLMTASMLLDLAALFAVPLEARPELVAAFGLLKEAEDSPDDVEDYVSSLPGIFGYTPEHRIERALIRAEGIDARPDWRALSRDQEGRIPRTSVPLYRAYMRTPLQPNARLTAFGRFLAREDDVEDLERLRGELMRNDMALEGDLRDEILAEVDGRMQGRRLGELIPLSLLGFVVFAVAAFFVRFVARRRLQS